MDNNRDIMLENKEKGVLIEEINQIPATVRLYVHITRYVSLDERSTVLTGRVNKDRCNTLSTGHLQCIITTQQQLKYRFNGLYYK